MTNEVVTPNNDTVLIEGNIPATGSSIQNDTRQKTCPAVPPNLVGPIKVWVDSPPFEVLAKSFQSLEPGGHGFPKDCQARHRVAIIIPYRDREEHLRILLRNLISLFIKQQLDFGIFVVEQKQNETFNRAKLMNVGFAEAVKVYDWQCFIFHDVDLLPENDRNLYSCPSQPRHMSVAIDKFKYRLPYGAIFGGVAALTKAQFEKINGFSNDYWGWGGEDDDLSTRVRIGGYKIARYPNSIARYKMIKHSSNKENPVNNTKKWYLRCRYKLMYKTKVRWQKDGLSSLKYKVLKITKYPLYTNIYVSLLEAESRDALHREGFKGC
uniref:Beta-1,4-N-acetylgalactosaminyltransferase n=1 Tax=Syphacia muris TaxID=451379 RepID=A0A0N5AH27_9BILA